LQTFHSNLPENTDSMEEEVLNALQRLKDPKKAPLLGKYFKTGPGEYGEGDKFLGIKVPDQRKVANQFWKEIKETELANLIKAEYHEIRLTSVFMLVKKFKSAKTQHEKESWVNFYLNNLNYINNWDLVDSSAHLILGPWLFEKDRKMLFDFARSGNLWDQRIAVLTTFNFIHKHDFADSLKLAEILLQHPHDLIHKAVGWMLREIGNRNYQTAFDFLKKHYKTMPRTMLRYAIEKYDPEVRKAFLKGRI
jgi:3-methyladenine DNA glycosylase AlkD